MGLGLYLYGDVLAPRLALLEEISAFVRERHGDVLLRRHIDVNESGHRALWLSLHPAEEDVEIRAVGPKRLLVSARTSGAGPGYHTFLCELLDTVATRFSVQWQPIDATGETGDETGYFHDRDVEKLEETMRGWVRGVAKSLLSMETSGWAGVAISLPAAGPQYEVEGAATPLGPRDAAFWQKATEDDATAQQLFPWWEQGTGAGYLLGRILCRMWTEVRWREPSSDPEEDLQDELVELLERGYALDPSRAWPFAEWKQLLKYRGQGETLPDGAPAPGKATIGYRRGIVIAQPFPGAQIRIPGSFSETFDKRGSWSAWEDGRTVWVSLLTARKKSEKSTPPMAETEPKLDALEENGEKMWRVTGKRVVVLGDEMRMLIVSIVVADEADQGWAFETYRAVRFQ